MTKPPENSDGEPPPDDNSIHTANASNSDLIDDDGLHKVNLMWEFPNLTANDEATVRYHHTKLLIELEQTFPNTLRVLDQHNKPLTDIPNALLTPGRHMASYDVHTITQQNDRTKFLIVHSIKTTLSVTKIRRQHNIQEMIKRAHVYLRKHHFEVTQWDIVSLGWLLNKHPKHHQPNMIDMYIRDKIEQTNPSKASSPDF